MKKCLYYGILLVIIPVLLTSCRSLALNVKHRSPATEQSILRLLWLWLLARFYANEKGRWVFGWQLEDLALLKIIKDNATPLWNHHDPGKKIIRLEDWKK